MSNHYQIGTETHVDCIDHDAKRAASAAYDAVERCAICHDEGYLMFSSFQKSGGKVCEACADHLSDDHFESGAF